MDHQGDWLRGRVARKRLSVSAFARRVGVSRGRAHEWFKQARLEGMREDLMWAVLDVLDLSKTAERHGWVRREPPPRRNGAPSPAVDLLRQSSQAAWVFENLMRQRGARGHVPTPEDDAEGGNNGFDQNVEPYSEQKIDVEIPLFELDVAAGRWTDISEIGEVCDPRAIDQGLFRVRIRGDSMKPKYADGDVVEFRCLRPDRDGIIIGRDYYVQRADGMATFKCVESVEDETITLRALNRRGYKEPIVVERALVVRMAMAVAKVEILA